MSLLLLYSGAQPAALPDLTANAAGFLTLTGHATAEVEHLVDWGPEGAGREEFQPRFLKPRPLITARAAASLVLVGHATATVTPEVAHAGVTLPKRSPPLARPPEEEREFRILARARGSLRLEGSSTAYTRILAAAQGELTLEGYAEVESSWPDDTAELVCVMLMLDQEAA